MPPVGPFKPQAACQWMDGCFSVLDMWRFKAGVDVTTVPSEMRR